MREHWIVDPFARTLEQVQGLVTVGLERERVRGLIAPDLEIALGEVFPG